jgi:hypothetical protein
MNDVSQNEGGERRRGIYCVKIVTSKQRDRDVTLTHARKRLYNDSATCWCVCVRA